VLSEGPSQSQKDGNDSKMKAKEFQEYTKWFDKTKDVISPPSVNPEATKKEKTKKK
jgi:hypothetical protein